MRLMGSVHIQMSVSRKCAMAKQQLRKVRNAPKVDFTLLAIRLRGASMDGVKSPMKSSVLCVLAAVSLSLLGMSVKRW